VGGGPCRWHPGVRIDAHAGAGVVVFGGARRPAQARTCGRCCSCCLARLIFLRGCRVSSETSELESAPARLRVLTMIPAPGWSSRPLGFVAAAPGEWAGARPRQGLEPGLGLGLTLLCAACAPQQAQGQRCRPPSPLPPGGRSARYAVNVVVPSPGLGALSCRVPANRGGPPAAMQRAHVHSPAPPPPPQESRTARAPPHCGSKATSTWVAILWTTVCS